MSHCNTQHYLSTETNTRNGLETFILHRHKHCLISKLLDIGYTFSTDDDSLHYLLLRNSLSWNISFIYWADGSIYYGATFLTFNVSTALLGANVLIAYYSKRFFVVFSLTSYFLLIYYIFRLEPDWNDWQYVFQFMILRVNIIFFLDFTNENVSQVPIYQIWRTMTHKEVKGRILTLHPVLN